MKNEFIPLSWKIDEFRFNILFGFLSLFVIPLLNKNIPIGQPVWWVGIIGICIYISEAWATFYKLNFARAAIIEEKSNGHFHDLTIVPRTPGTTLWYAFIMRFCLRFGIIIFSLMAFGYDTENTEPSVFIMILLCCSVLFELFLMMFTMFETRVFSGSSKDEEDEKAEEQKWRTKMVQRVKEKNHLLKLKTADIIIFITATISTNLIWDPMNESMITFIDDQAKTGSLAFAVIFFVLVALIMSVLLLLPLRVAYWTESAMRADDTRSKLRYRLSYLFAVLCVFQPAVVFIFKTLFF